MLQNSAAHQTTIPVVRYIIRVAKHIRLKELKHGYPKEDGYKKTQHCITLLFLTLKCNESNELEARKAELDDLADWIRENEQYLSLKRREPHVQRRDVTSLKTGIPADCLVGKPLKLKFDYLADSSTEVGSGITMTAVATCCL